MCPKALFLIVSRSRMMFHAEEVLSEFFREGEWKGVKSRRDEIGVASQFIGWYKRSQLDAVCRRYIDIREI